MAAATLRSVLRRNSLLPLFETRSLRGLFFFSSSDCVLQALRFYGSYNVTVTGITIQNSPQCHLKFDNCEAVQVFNVTIASPGSSPNTDGIHLQNSRDVMIHHTNMSCGKLLFPCSDLISVDFRSSG